jgi:hypothetical protein
MNGGKILQVIIILELIFWVIKSDGQTTCSQTTPCVQLTYTNSQATFPVTVSTWKCMGSQNTCNASSLATAQAGASSATPCPAVSGVWTCFSFSQTKSPQNYNEPETWGSLMNYATQWITTGGVSASTPILIFPIPQNTVPPAGSIVAGSSVVISGAPGPQ